MAYEDIFLENYDPQADNTELYEPKKEIGSGKTTESGRERRSPGFYQQKEEVVEEDEQVMENPFATQKDIMASMFANLPERPAPEYDKGREKRLSTMASASGIGKALSLMGDAFGASRGAVVQPTKIQPDAYVDTILQDRKEHKDKMDQYEQQKYMDSIRRASGLAQAEIGDVASARQEAVRKEGIERADRIRGEDIDREQQRYESGLEEARRREAEAAARADRAFDLQKSQAEEASQYRKDALELQRDKALWDNMYKQQTIGGKIYELVTPDGKQKIQVRDAGELQAVYSAIINDPDPQLQADAMAKLKIMRSKLEGMNTTDLKNFVQEFWHRSPKAQEVISGLRGGATATQSAAPPAGVPAYIAAQSTGQPTTTVGGVPMARPEGDTEVTTTVQAPGVQAEKVETAEGEATKVTMDRDAVGKAIAAKDAMEITKLMKQGNATDDQIDAVLKQYGITRAKVTEDEPTEQKEAEDPVDQKYPPKIAKKVKKGSMYANWARKAAADLADEKGLEPGSQERSEFIEQTAEEMKAEHEEYQSREDEAREKRAEERKASGTKTIGGVKFNKPKQLVS